MPINNNDIVNVRKLPIIGEWVGKIGQVQEIMALPCGPSLDIWVTAAWVNLPKLAWSLLAPDCLDAMLSRGAAPHLRGKGAGRVPHKYRRRGKLNRWNVVDPNGGIGNQGNQIPIPKGAVWTAMWRIFGLTQQVGLYMVVIDAGVEFLVNWTSLAMQAAGCETADPKVAKGEITPGDIHGDTGSFSPDFWEATWNNGNVQFTNHIRIDNIANALLGVTYEFKVADFEPTGSTAMVEARLIDAHNGFVYKSLGPIAVRKGDTTSLAYLASINLGFFSEIDVIPELRVSDAAIEFVSSTANVLLSPNPFELLQKSPCIPEPIDWPTQYLPQLPNLADLV